MPVLQAELPALEAAPTRGRRRHLRLVAALAVMSLGLATVSWVANDLVGASHELNQARQATARQRHELALARYIVVLLEQRLATTVRQGRSMQSALDAASQELTQTQAELSGTTGTISQQDIDIGTLDTCLNGVNQALGQTGDGNQAGAVAAIQAVSSSCLSLEPGGSSGPVYAFDFPDPFVMLVGSTYYAYGTNSAAGNVQILSSPDLVHWTAVGNALPSMPAWAMPGDTWAPAVLQVGPSYVLYYTVKDQAGGQECISDALASDPTGPFVDSSTAPLECQTTLGGSIDPDAFVDAGGQAYLVWKSEGGGGQPPTIWSQPLDAAGTGFLPATSPTPLLQPSQGWEEGVVEAPDLVLTGTVYDLFYSGANWSSNSYAIGEAVCQGPSGPCSKPLGAPVVRSGAAFSGPGGPTVFHDTTGAPWLSFAAYLPQAVGFPNSRLLFLRPLALNGDLLTVSSG